MGVIAKKINDSQRIENGIPVKLINAENSWHAVIVFEKAFPANPDLMLQPPADHLGNGLSSCAEMLPQPL